jgi:threonine dehydrogenase-like Zn-dependent dehydrogenase
VLGSDVLCASSALVLGTISHKRLRGKQTQPGNHFANRLPILAAQVPGHEIVGIVEEVGANVTEYKIGDKGAVCRSDCS